MKEQIIGAVVGAIITGLFSVLIFHLGNFSTQDSIVEALSVRFDSVDESMSYEQALQAVYEEVEQLKVNSTTLEKSIDESNADYSTLQSENENLQAEIESLKNKDNRIEQIALAESYASSGNYEIAIPILNEITEKTEDVNALLKDYITNYEASVISNAESLAINGNFDEATALIDEALKIVPDSQMLLDKKNTVTPKYLVDTVECYKSENLWRLDSKEYMKMSGKSYKHAIFTQQSDTVASMFNRAYSANAFYNLDGKYSQLSGIVGHIDFSGSGTIGENDGGQVYDAEITIWGDDKEICTISLSANDTAKEFNYSVEGVNILEFRVKCKGNSSVGIAEIQIH
jgi:tetratricopeptide (TPR) repeat protein